MRGRSVRLWIEDILIHAEKAIAFLGDLPDATALARDEKTLYAIVRALEIMGEASKRVPATIRRHHPDIPWREMAAMRDVLAHADFGIDVAIVSRTVVTELPPLLPRLRALRDGLARKEDDGPGGVQDSSP